MALAGVGVWSWRLVLWTSHFPSPTAARAGATRSPAGGADPMDTPPCESQLPGRRKRQSRHCPKHSWPPFLPLHQRRRPPRLWTPDTVLPCWPGMRAAPATAWQPQVGSRRSAPQLPAPGSLAPGPRGSLTPPSRLRDLSFICLVFSEGIFCSFRSFLGSLSQTSPLNFLTFPLTGLCTILFSLLPGARPIPVSKSSFLTPRSG